MKYYISSDQLPASKKPLTSINMALPELFIGSNIEIPFEQTDNDIEKWLNNINDEEEPRH